MEEKVEHILVPVAGSEADDEAVRIACTMARRYHARVSIIHVIEVARTLPLDAEVPEAVAKGEAALERAEDIADEMGVEVFADLLQARLVGPAVVDEANDLGVDLILIGLPYKTRFGEFYLDSSASYILSHARCRVWLCRVALTNGEKTG